MILDCERYVGPCECGRVHTLETKLVAVDYGCLADFDRYMDECGLRGRRVVLYDTNTYNLPGMVHVRADKEIVGIGTLMDFARYPAYKLGVPFVAIPTLASSDGFTANICSVVVDGQKESIPMKAPRLVVADLNIISKAPQHLLVSGVADILAKYISLADWRIANIASGEYYCPRVAGVARRALKLMAGTVDRMLRGFQPDYLAMTMAQMLGGLSMQLLNNSRAASGAEHLIAHLVEMKPPRFENANGIHGECVGVGAVLCAEEYHRMAARTPKAKPYKPLDEAWVNEKFGPLAPGIFKANEDDCLAGFDPQNIVDNWDEIREVIGGIPSAEEFAWTLHALGGKYRLEDIGIDESLRGEVLDISAAIRNRLTLARMRRVLDFGEED